MFKSAVLMLLIACGQDVKLEPNKPAAPAPPDLESSLQFLLDAWVIARPGNIPITTPVSFDTFAQRGILGVCITWKDDSTGEITKEIRIDRESFENYLTTQNIGAKVIVDHELAHCELDRPHTEDLAIVGDTTIPFSIMYPSLWEDLNVYSDFDDHYNDELFGGNGILERIPATRTTEQIIMLMQEPGKTGIAIIN